VNESHNRKRKYNPRDTDDDKREKIAIVARSAVVNLPES
jgi:hypothetical protein